MATSVTLGADHGVGSDEDLTIVHQRQVEVGVTALAPISIAAPVRIHRAFEVQTLPRRAEERLHEFGTALRVGQRRGVEFELEITLGGLQIKKAVHIIRQVDLAREHKRHFLARRIIDNRLGDRLVFGHHWLLFGVLAIVSVELFCHRLVFDTQHRAQPVKDSDVRLAPCGPHTFLIENDSPCSQALHPPKKDSLLAASSR